MIKLWMVCLTVGLTVLLQTQTSPTAAENSTAAGNATSRMSTVNLTTSEPPTSLSTMNVTNSTGNGGFSLHSSNLFLALTIITSIFHLSC